MGFKLTIVGPEGIVYEQEDVDFVVLPAKLGELGILKRHTPLISALKKGKIKVKKGTGQTESFNVNSGFVEVLPDKVTVLTNEV